MMNSLLILKTEIRQGRAQFLLVTLISFLLGVSVHLATRAEQKISDIAIKVDWNADLAILPKGVNLEDFRKELISAHTSDFIPEALFDTTVGLSEGQFRLSAVLAITDADGSRIMQKGSDLGLDWLKGRQKISAWQPQTLYQTPEWGTKLLSGFFASGTQAAMQSLKQLIDKKTVAQAIWIQRQQEQNDQTQDELKLALAIFSGVLLLMAVLSFTSILIWLKIRLSNTFRVMDEIGFRTQSQWIIMSGMAILFALIPAFIGFLVG